MSFLSKSIALAVAFTFLGIAMPAQAAKSVQFDAGIWPILAEHCIQCHGEADQKGGLRLDSPDAIRKGGEFGEIIEVGDHLESALFELISLPADDDDRMPSKGDPLSKKLIKRIATWIDQGAPFEGWTPEMAITANATVEKLPKAYESHWAFTAPKRPKAPKVSDKKWPNNEVDRFVLAKLQENDLSPSARADRITLLRRLSLDLIGLPPTLEEADRVLADDDKDWYQNLLERLLASPHYGERWARHWLDAAQYADSDGFEKDKPREVSAWRDWVVQAFNDDMPYDQFVIEQVAGDLLPNATQAQRVATGFLRNSLQNEEGGADPEQFRMEAIFNRMDVIGRSVLGLTVGCAQCHSHKYDPLTQTDYYRMFAFLNSTHEATISVFSPAEQQRRSDILARIASIESDLKVEHPNWREELAEWEAHIRALPNPDWEVLELTFDDTSAGGQKALAMGDGSYINQSYAPTRYEPKMTATTDLKTITAVRLELMTDGDLPRNGPGRSIYGAAALSEFQLRTAHIDEPIKSYGDWTPVEIASAIGDVNPPVRVLSPEFPNKENSDEEEKRTTGPVAMAIDGDLDTAWSTDIDPGRRNQPRHAVFKLAEPLNVEPDMQLAFKLAQKHGGWNSNDNQNNNVGRFRIAITDSEALSDEAIPLAIQKIVSIPVADRTQAQNQTLFTAWRESNPKFSEANTQIDSLWQTHPVGTTQLAMIERDKPRDTYVLQRGDFLSPTDRVDPGAPSFLHSMDDSKEPNRLAFAKWLVDSKSPTTARAIVNRIWQHYFGEGLVATSSDLGLQGELPTHPELLDWLSVEFMESGWSIKQLHRLILNSSTYQQISRIQPALLEKDPYNKLLARGARYRVDGEIVRDIALAASGLLNPTIGGASVHPPAPEYLFLPPASYGTKYWPTETGPDRYRRALYTFRFRSVAYPVLQAFDAPAGNAPCTRRDVTNSPLQALTTLNEPLFYESAVALADQTLREGGDTDRDRIEYAFRRCLTRFPEASDIATLEQFLEKQRARLASGELDATLLVPESEDSTNENHAERAAWTLTARVLLNLDETIIRQ